MAGSSCAGYGPEISAAKLFLTGFEVLFQSWHKFSSLVYALDAEHNSVPVHTGSM